MAGGITRRKLLVGGGAGIGLIVAWSLWPRRYVANLATAPGETILGPFLKVGEDGHVVIIVPQVETGQGAWTALPQILADELGADWQTVAVEPAPIGPLYANKLAADMLAADVLPVPLRGIGAEWAPRWAGDHAFMMTGFSTSVRAFEAPLRAAGAAARTALCMAAAERWDADWRACETQDGFVVRGRDRIRFAELAADAARRRPPDPSPLRAIGAGGLSGHGVARLDAPAKIDGSYRYAADVRLPGMVFAAIRQAPPGNSRLIHLDKAAARHIPDLVAIFDNPGWVAAVADNWWAANHALDALAPRFETDGGLPDDRSIDDALTTVLSGRGTRVAGQGKPDALLGAEAITADYAAGPAMHAALETPAATARILAGRLELWAATQAPSAMRAAAASAIDYAEDDVTLYPMPMGGGFGAGFDTRVGEQAAILALKVGRPVQLMWSRVEDALHDRFRPPARARLSARLRPGGIAAWHAAVATPATVRETIARLIPGLPVGQGAEQLAVDGTLPPYAIAATAIDHHPADIGMLTGVLRGEAAGYATFFTESFVDELAGKAAIDPLSFRIDMLGDHPRLAACLSAAAMLGGWEGGGAGSGQGIACFAGYGSFVAVIAQVHVDAGSGIVVDRLSAAVDCGRMINPDLVRQQIEGGLLFALPAAIGQPITITRGLPDQRRLEAIGLPVLARTPEVRVQLLASTAEPGGVSGLAVPPVAPAIANALFAVNGHRCRRLPLSPAG